METKNDTSLAHKYFLALRAVSTLKQDILKLEALKLKLNNFDSNEAIKLVIDGFDFKVIRSEEANILISFIDFKLSILNKDIKSAESNLNNIHLDRPT